MEYHIYEDHNDLHLQIDSPYSVIIIEGRKEIEKLLAKVKEALKKEEKLNEISH